MTRPIPELDRFVTRILIPKMIANAKAMYRSYEKKGHFAQDEKSTNYDLLFIIYMDRDGEIVFMIDSWYFGHSGDYGGGITPNFTMTSEKWDYIIKKTSQTFQYDGQKERTDEGFGYNDFVIWKSDIFPKFANIPRAYSEFSSEHFFPE